MSRAGFVVFLARLMLRSQYRRIEVEGADRVPLEGPVLLVANHFTSLADSMALLHASPRVASFLAKAPLFKSWLLKPFLEAVGSVPVFRPQDTAENEGRGARANLETFAACRSRLAEGGSLAIFPEGVSQPQPRLMPVRTGAARIVIDVERPVAIVPAGLVYAPETARGRGTLLVRFGEPFTVNGSEGYASRREAIATVTRRIEASLRELLAEAESQGEIVAMRTLRVVREQEQGLPPPRTLAEEHLRHRRMARALARLRDVAPGELEALRSETDAYARALELAGIPAEFLAIRYTPGRVGRFLLKEVPLYLLGTPLGLLAAVLTWPARKLGDILALRAFGGAEDVRAVCRMLGGGLLIVVTTLLLALVALFAWSPWAALGVLVGLPLLLAFHVRWQDLRDEVKTRVRCFLLLAGGALRQNLLAQRRKLGERLEAAEAALVRSDPGEDAA